ncbi:MAG: LuxR C-terminal-related transcriptional regulator [Acidimicrobiales bacterium]
MWLRTRPHTCSVVDLREQDQVTLTRREREILLLLAEGAPTTEIARTLYLSTNTVRNHVRRLLSHLGASSRLEAVVVAAKMGLLELRREPGA